MVTNWARVERLALADGFDETGPDAATLCTGWNARRLAAHLIVRERRPLAAAAAFAGAGVRPLKHYAVGALRSEARRPWNELVDLVRTGPPSWSPTRLAVVDSRLNTIEFFVHHEDLRRAQVGWQPRELPGEQAEDLWRHVVGAARLFLRGLPVGLMLQRPGRPPVRVREREPTVTVTGDPGELALYVTGRRDHAKVQLLGDDDALERLAAATIRA